MAAITPLGDSSLNSNNLLGSLVCQVIVSRIRAIFLMSKIDLFSFAYSRFGLG